MLLTGINLVCCMTRTEHSSFFSWGNLRTGSTAPWMFPGTVELHHHHDCILFFLLSYLSLSPFTSLYFTLSFSACFVSCVKVKRNSLGIGGCCLFYLPWFVLFLWCSCLVSLMNHLESWLKCVLVFSFWFPWLPCRPLLPTLLIVCCGKFLVWGLLYFCYFLEGECNAMNHWQTTTEPNGRATDHRKICYVFHSVLYTYIAKAMSVKIVVQCNQ